MLVDSHCHLDRLDLERFGGLAGVLETAEAHGVTRLLSVATDLESWPVLARLTEPYPQIALSVGVHPSEDGGRAPTKVALTALGREARVVAIGETGLDYHYGADSADRQRDWFRVHIAAARELGKPLIVHTRAARADTRIAAQLGAPPDPASAQVLLDWNAQPDVANAASALSNLPAIQAAWSNALNSPGITP